jgi:hypothetical protein
LINLDKTQQTLIENGYNQLYKFKHKKKLVNFSHGSEKGAKNSYGSYPTEFVFEVKNEN